MARPVATPIAASNRNRAILMVAVVLGIASFALMFAFLNSRDGGSNQAVDDALAGPGAESVVVVARDIPVGTRVTRDMLEVRTIPGAALLTGRVTSIDDVVDKVATAPMFAGEQVTTVKVTTFEGQNSIAFKVPDGMRAFSLTVPHESWIVGGLPQPGDRVDILAITVLSRIDPLTGEERPDLTSGIIAQNAEILAVSQTVVQSVTNVDVRATVTPVDPAASVTAVPSASVTPVAQEAEGRPLDTGETFQTAISITIALPPDLAAKVSIIDAMADDVGQWRLFVRQKGDDRELDGTTVWTLDDVFPQP